MLIWADGFGAYGNTNAFRDSGFYVYRTNSGQEPLQIGTGGAARTGGYYWYARGMCYSDWYGGHMFGGARTIVGAGAAFLFPALPGNSNFRLFMFCGDQRTNHQCSVRVNNDGSVSVIQGKDGTVWGTSAVGVITPNAYAYVEAKAFIDSVNGSVEVRVNNVSILTVTGQNTNPLGLGFCQGIMTGSGNSGDFGGFGPCEAIADYVIWDATGAFNNDFIGDVRCRTFFPATDGPLQDWTPTASPAYGEIDSLPIDAAKYISSAVVGDKSNFGKVAVPINTAYIAGINLMTAANKSDAGTCEITPQLVGSDGTSVDNGTPISPGTGIARYNSIFETDPATGLQFLAAAFDSALMQVERTA